MAFLQIQIYSQTLQRSVPITAVLPTDRQRSDDGTSISNKKAYKTLYLLHGYSDSCMEWCLNTRIQRLAEAQNMAVIMPSGENSFYVDQKGSNRAYGRWIGEELVNLTRAMFPLSDKREDTFIAGNSMGAFGALIAGLHYPNTFGKIALFSGAFHIFEEMFDKEVWASHGLCEIFGEYQNALLSQNNPRNALMHYYKTQAVSLPEIYMICGTEDSLLGSNRSLHTFIANMQFPIVYKECPGEHSWEFWNSQLEDMLDWILK